MGYKKIKLILLFIAYVLILNSCNKEIKNSLIKVSNTENLKTIDSSSIITNSLDPNFDGDLIKTKKVAKGDTILFREWGNLKNKPIIIYDDKIKYILSKDTVSKFYKTGDEIFSKNEILILNTLTKKDFKINSIVILDNDARDIYANNQPSSYFKIKKISNTKGEFDFSSEKYKEFNIDFKVTNDALHIVKLSNLSYSNLETYNYELDTLIVLRNKDFIYPDSLRYLVCKEKNRIPSIKDNKTVAEYLTLGSDKEELKDYQGAIVYYDKAIRLEPKNAVEYYLVLCGVSFEYHHIGQPKSETTNRRREDAEIRGGEEACGKEVAFSSSHLRVSAPPVRFSSCFLQASLTSR